MGKYEYRTTYLNLKNKEYGTNIIIVDANTKWGAWTKALYAAMEKEEGDYILVGVVCCNYREVSI